MPWCPCPFKNEAYMCTGLVLANLIVEDVLGRQRPVKHAQTVDHPLHLGHVLHQLLPRQDVKIHEMLKTSLCSLSLIGHRCVMTEMLEDRFLLHHAP